MDSAEREGLRPKGNVPNLRFPEFQGEWEKCKVSDLLDFYSTNSLSWDKLEYGTTNIQNLHYGLIHVGLSTMVDIDKDNLPNIIDGNVPRNYELCKEGDIVFADASEDTNEVAKAVEYYNLNGKKLFVAYIQFMDVTTKIKQLSAIRATLFHQCLSTIK